MQYGSQKDLWVVFKYFSGVVGVFASKDLEFKNEKANDYSNWTNGKTLRKERERERERERRRRRRRIMSINEAVHFVRILSCHQLHQFAVRSCSVFYSMVAFVLVPGLVSLLHTHAQHMLSFLFDTLVFSPSLPFSHLATASAIPISCATDRHNI